MDIVYKEGAVNHADALSRRPDLKDSLQKVQMLRDWTNDEAKCELHAHFFRGIMVMTHHKSCKCYAIGPTMK
jgi:hypothetical protein